MWQLLVHHLSYTKVYAVTMFIETLSLHRYEREEAFHSLQVTVKNCRLEDSLEQFVNGEILEGDNAYFCEKCSVRVSDCSLDFVEILLQGSKQYNPPGFPANWRLRNERKNSILMTCH